MRRDNSHVKVGFVVAVALFATTSTALAKGPDSARLCGATGCVTTRVVEVVNVLALWTSGFGARAEPASAPFFTVDLTSSRGTKEKWSFLYVPSARAVKVVRADFSGGVYGVQAMNAWVSPSDDVLAVYERETADISPYAGNDGWVVKKEDERDLPWVAIVLLIALAAAALLISRRFVTRRSARLAYE